MRAGRRRPTQDGAPSRQRLAVAQELQPAARLLDDAGSPSSARRGPRAPRARRRSSGARSGRRGRRARRALLASARRAPRGWPARARRSSACRSCRRRPGGRPGRGRGSSPAARRGPRDAAPPAPSRTPSGAAIPKAQGHVTTSTAVVTARARGDVAGGEPPRDEARRRDREDAGDVEPGEGAGTTASCAPTSGLRARACAAARAAATGRTPSSARSSAASSPALRRRRPARRRQRRRTVGGSRRRSSRARRSPRPSRRAVDRHQVPRRDEERVAARELRAAHELHAPLADAAREQPLGPVAGQEPGAVALDARAPAASDRAASA